MRTLYSYMLFAAVLVLLPSLGVAQWVQVGSGMGQVWEVVVDPTNEQILYAGSNTTGVWKTTNGGTSWAQINTGLSSLVVQALTISRTDHDILYCGTTGGMFLTVDGGGSWFAINSGIVESPVSVQAIAVDPTTSEVAYTAVWDAVVNATNGLYKTTDNGLTWFPITTGIGVVKNFLSLAINPLNRNTIYAGTSFLLPNGSTTEQCRMYKSLNGGASWTEISTGLPVTQGNTSHDPVRKLHMNAADTNRVLAAIFLNDIQGGMYLTTNGGTSWIKRHNGIDTVAPGTVPRAALIRPGTTNEFYAGVGTERGIFRTSDAGLSWTPFNSGGLTTPTTIRSFAFAPSSNYLYAGAAHASDATLQGVFRIQLPPVSVPITPSGIPSDFVLHQNYPNPFNPSTKITYGLPERDFVTLKVYNVLGQDVATLVEGTMAPGYHEVTFDGAGLPSGMYFYRLQAGSFAQTKRLMLMK